MEPIYSEEALHQLAAGNCPERVANPHHDRFTAGIEHGMAKHGPCEMSRCARAASTIGCAATAERKAIGTSVNALVLACVVECIF